MLSSSHCFSVESPIVQGSAPMVTDVAAFKRFSPFNSAKSAERTLFFSSAMSGAGNTYGPDQVIGQNEQTEWIPEYVFTELL